MDPAMVITEFVDWLVYRDRVKHTGCHSTVERFGGGAKTATPTGVGVWFRSYIFSWVLSRKAADRAGVEVFPSLGSKNKSTPRFRTDRQAHRQDNVVGE